MACEADWIIDLGDVGRKELSRTDDIYVGDLGENGWAALDCEGGCLTPF